MRRARKTVAAGLLGSALAVAGSTPAQAAVAPYVISPQQNKTYVQAGTNIAPAGGDDFVLSLSTTSRQAGMRMPFPVTVYGQSYSAMVVSSNGNIQFPSAGTSPSAAYTNSCLPTRMPSPLLAVYWDDLEFAPAGTTTPGEGIFTAVKGQAPHRQFIVNWRGHLFAQPTAASRAGVIFTEGSSRISFQYYDNTAATATIGIQRNPRGTSTQWTCNSGGSVVSTGLRLDFLPR